MRKRSRVAGLAGALALFGAAGWLATAAAPRVASSLASLPAESALAREQRGRPPSAAERRGAIRSLEAGVSLRETGRLRTDLALLRLLLLDRQAAIRIERDLPGIRDELRRGLALAPANPYAWTRLAAVDAALGTDMPRARSALGLAFRTGPHEPALAAPRVRLALDLCRAAAPARDVGCDEDIDRAGEKTIARPKPEKARDPEPKDR